MTHCCSLSGASALGKQGAEGKPLCSPEKPRLITSLRKQDRSCQGFVVARAEQKRTICAGRRAPEPRRCRLAPSYPALSNLPYAGASAAGPLCRSCIRLLTAEQDHLIHAYTARPCLVLRTHVRPHLRLFSSEGRGTWRSLQAADTMCQ